jgi:hypothetical protein
MKCNYLLLAFLLWGTIFFPMASAENASVLSEIGNSSIQIPETFYDSMVSFDGLSESKSEAKMSDGLMVESEKSRSKIPSSIKKYDLLTIDIPKMREKLDKKETISVRINGEPYDMVI